MRMARPGENNTYKLCLGDFVNILQEVFRVFSCFLFGFSVKENFFYRIRLTRNGSQEKHELYPTCTRTQTRACSVTRVRARILACRRDCEDKISEIPYCNLFSRDLNIAKIKSRQKKDVEIYANTMK